MKTDTDSREMISNCEIDAKNKRNPNIRTLRSITSLGIFEPRIDIVLKPDLCNRIL